MQPSLQLNPHLLESWPGIIVVVSGEQPISSAGQSEDMGPWTGATEEPSSRTRYVCIMCSYAVQ